jgi:hypothetical protein
MRLLLALAWLGVGSFGIVTVLGHRSYFQSLPHSRGNDKLRRHGTTYLLISTAMIGIGMWHLYMYLRP